MECGLGRVEYLNDPAAPKPNSLFPAAGVLAVDNAGPLLLQRHRDTGQWAIPMGKQELGETTAQCAVRETLEETGVTVEVTGILALYSNAPAGFGFPEARWRLTRSAPDPGG